MSGHTIAPPSKVLKHLGNVKADRQVAMIQHAATMALHAECVGGIIYDLKIYIYNLLDCIDMARMAIAVNRHDRRGMGRNGRFDLR